MASPLRRLYRRRALPLFAVLALVLLYTALRALVASDAAQDRIMTRLREELSRRTHLPVSAKGRASVGVLGSIRFDDLEIELGEGGPRLALERMVIEPSASALVRGRFVPRSLRLRKGRLASGTDREAWSSAFANLRAPAGEANQTADGGGSASPPDSTSGVDFELRDVELVMDWEGLVVPLPYACGRLTNHGADAELVFDHGGLLELNAHQSDDGSVDVRLSARRLWAADLPAQLVARLPLSLSGSADMRATLIVAAQGTFASIDLSLTTDDLTLQGPELGDTPLGPLPLELALQVEWDGTLRLLSLPVFQLWMPRPGVSPGASPGGALAGERVWTAGVDRPALGMSGNFDLDAEGAMAIVATVDRLELDSLIALLPATLRPPPSAPVPTGELTAQVDISGPTWQPLLWTVNSRVDLSKVDVRGQSSLDLRAAFVHRFVDPDGHDRSLLVGGANPDFVPIDELPAHVPAAVTTSEDGGFFTHRGFDFDEIKNSFVAVTEAGRAVRGGSTITQQLAKNLFLSRERTLARKVREALITLALEASVPKRRLLEIYLNVIEWGPGLYGIGPAAQQYFDKDARTLTLKEAAYLATIIPNPHRYFVYFERGELSEVWTARLSDLLLKMTENGVLGEEARAQALAAPLVFAPRQL